MVEQNLLNRPHNKHHFFTIWMCHNSVFKNLLHSIWKVKKFTRKIKSQWDVRILWKKMLLRHYYDCFTCHLHLEQHNKQHSQQQQHESTDHWSFVFSFQITFPYVWMENPQIILEFHLIIITHVKVKTSRSLTSMYVVLPILNHFNPLSNKHLYKKKFTSDQKENLLSHNIK